MLEIAITSVEVGLTTSLVADPEKKGVSNL
jgi:hypothetical protein